MSLILNNCPNCQTAKHIHVDSLVNTMRVRCTQCMMATPECADSNQAAQTWNIMTSAIADRLRQLGLVYHRGEGYTVPGPEVEAIISPTALVEEPKAPSRSILVCEICGRSSKDYPTEAFAIDHIGRIACGECLFKNKEEGTPIK